MKYTSRVLTLALDSITEDKKWGGEAQPIEEVLDPDDWRLIEIHNFRFKVQAGNTMRREKMKADILSEVDKFNLKDDVQKCGFMYQMGLSSLQISRLLNRSKSWADSHCNKMKCKKARYRHTELADVLKNIVEHEKKVGMR